MADVCHNHDGGPHPRDTVELSQVFTGCKGAASVAIGDVLWFVDASSEQKQKINAITNRYLQSAKGKDMVAKQAIEAGGGTPADAVAFVKQELEKWEPVIKAANISLN